MFIYLFIIHNIHIHIRILYAPKNGQKTGNVGRTEGWGKS